MEISGNNINIDGVGISDGTNYSVSVAIQSTTSGGTVYDGLKIKNNTVTVTGDPDAVAPSVIRGFWENGHNKNAAIELSGNKFLNANASNTADLNTTIALAIISVVYVQYVGIKIMGAKSHIGKFITFASPIAFFVGILEIVSEFSRILSFAFRLFGNIFAGEVLLAVVSFLIPFGASFPFLLLETFVGLIQALVFAMLSAVLFRLAVSEHH
jgi:F-type H+-transporting ATPase subunit a